MRFQALLLPAVLAVSVLAGCTMQPPPEAPSIPTEDPQRQDATVPPASGNLTIHVVDVGQGDGLVVHFPNRTVVVDTGRWSGASETAVRDHLAREDADPGALVITHPDADHAGGCDDVLAAFEIETVYHPGTSRDTQTWRDCEQSIAAEGARELTDREMDPGKELDWSDEAYVELLHLDGSANEDPNEGSIAVEIRFGSFEAILTGDIGCRTENQIMARGLVDDVDVLQVGHHGSAGSTCDAWLDRTQPEAAFVSVGADNNYGHPAPETLDRLREHSVEIYRTDVQGAITITANETTWRVAEGITREASDDQGSEDGSQPSTNRTVEIVDVRADAPGNDNENLTQEWLTMANRANRTIDLAGWTLADSANHEYVFTNATMAPDAQIRVHTGIGEDNATDVYWGRDRAVWNNDGDRARLLDTDGNVVDVFEY